MLAVVLVEVRSRTEAIFFGMKEEDKHWSNVSHSEDKVRCGQTEMIWIRAENLYNRREKLKVRDASVQHTIYCKVLRNPPLNWLAFVL